MPRFWIAAFACLIIFTSITALGSDHCEECPFPMAELYGEWSSNQKGIKVLVREIRRTTAFIEVSVSIRRLRDGEPLLQGHGIGLANRSEIQVRLTGKNGATRIHWLWIDPENGDLIINASTTGLPGQCETEKSCIRLHRQPRMSAAVFGHR